MNKEKLDRYKTFISFLAETLGPDYEIVLHTIDKNDNAQIAGIENGHITQRKIGSSTSEFAENLIKNKDYEKKEFVTNYKAFSKNNQILKGSTFFLKENDTLEGLICINFNPEKYVNLAETILDLANIPLSLIQNSPISKKTTVEENPVEFFSESIEEIIYSLVDPVLLNDKVTLNPNEKRQIVEELYLKGVFNLKDAVPEVAAILKSSIPTIYRYLKKVQE